MIKSIRISDFAKHIFPDQSSSHQASEILQGFMEARSPRLSDIAAKMPGNEAASYKRIQRFLQENDPQATLKLLFNEEADFVIGDPTEIERPHAGKNEYVGTLMDGETKGLWIMTNMEPEAALALYDQRMKIEICFRDLKSLLHIDKVMNKSQEYLNKMLAMIILAYAICLVVGETIRDVQYAQVVPDELNLLKVPLVEKRS